MSDFAGSLKSCSVSCDSSLAPCSRGIMFDVGAVSTMCADGKCGECAGFMYLALHAARHGIAASNRNASHRSHSRTRTRSACVCVVLVWRLATSTTTTLWFGSGRRTRGARSRGAAAFPPVKGNVRCKWKIIGGRYGVEISAHAGSSTRNAC